MKRHLTQLAAVGILACGGAVAALTTGGQPTPTVEDREPEASSASESRGSDQAAAKRSEAPKTAPSPARGHQRDAQLRRAEQARWDNYARVAKAYGKRHGEDQAAKKAKDDKPAAKPESDATTKPKSGAESKPKSESKAKSKPKTEAKPGTQPASSTKPAPKADPKPVPTGPSQVKNLSAKGRDGSSIQLTWDADPLHDQLHDYQLQRRVGSGDWRTIFYDQDPTTSFVDKDVRSGRQYAYRVRSRLTTRNEGPYSDVVTVSTATSTPARSSNPTPSEPAPTQPTNPPATPSGNYAWLGQPTRPGSASQAFVGPWHQVNSESPGRLDAIANDGSLPSFVTNVGRAQFSNAGGSQRARAIFEHGRVNAVPYWTEGSEFWYGAFFYFQPGFRNALNSSVDFHRWDAYVNGSNDMQGGLGVRRDGRLRIQNNWPYREPLIADYVPPEGQWLHIEVGQKLSSRDGGGWSEIWVNGERVARSTNANYYGDRYSGNAARISRHRIGLFGSAQRNPIELRFAYQTIGHQRHGDPRR